MYAFGPGWSVVVVSNRDDTGALELQTPASLISPSAIRDYAVELRGFEPLTPSLRTRCSARLSYSPFTGTGILPVTQRSARSCFSRDGVTNALRT